MIAFMKDIRLATQIFYQFGALKIYKTKYVIPSPPTRSFKTPTQMAIEDNLNQGMKKMQAKSIAKTHPNLQVYKEIYEKEKQKYKAEQVEYKQKYKLHHPTKLGVLLEYLYQKYPNQPYTLTQYVKVLDGLPAQEKERVLNICAEKYQKIYKEATELNQQFKETYRIPRRTSLRQIFARKHHFLINELHQQFSKLTPEEIQQLEEERKVSDNEYQQRFENLAKTFGLSVEEFKKELAIATGEFRKANKAKASSESSSDSSSSDKEEKQEEKKEEKK